MKNNFLKGVKDGIPICLGYLSVSFAFGIFAVGQGLSPFEAVLISMTNLTSAGQLAAVPIIAGGGSFLELAVSQLVINLRYALMSVSLSQRFHGSVGTLKRLVIAFGNTDEVFAVASSQKREIKASYMYGLILTPFLGWSTGTAIGAFLGNILPEILLSALGIAIYGMFVAIVVPIAKTERAVLYLVLLSAALSLIFNFVPLLKAVPTGFTIIICAVLASAVLAVLRPVKEESEDA